MRPKQESGINLVWPTMRKESVILLFNPAHTRYYRNLMARLMFKEYRQPGAHKMRA